MFHCRGRSSVTQNRHQVVKKGSALSSRVNVELVSELLKRERSSFYVFCVAYITNERNKDISCKSANSISDLLERSITLFHRLIKVRNNLKEIHCASFNSCSTHKSKSSENYVSFVIKKIATFVFEPYVVTKVCGL